MRNRRIDTSTVLYGDAIVRCMHTASVKVDKRESLIKLDTLSPEKCRIC